jgi:hypothetical protein
MPASGLDHDMSLRSDTAEVIFGGEIKVVSRGALKGNPRSQ